MTADAEGAREARYAEAMYGRAILPNQHTDERVRAVMAVADEEQAALRAEVERLTTLLDSRNRIVEKVKRLAQRWQARAEAAEDRLRVVAELADEWESDRHRVLDDEKDPRRLGWRTAVVDHAQRLRAVLAAPPAAPEASEAACEHPYRDVAQEVIGCPPVLACNRCGHTRPAPVVAPSAEERPAWREYDDADDMCPNCVTPWKCNGPHVPSAEEPAEDVP